MLPQSVLDAFAKVNLATNNLAGVVRSLRDQIKAGMSQADVDAVLSKLDGVAGVLDGIAVDPDNPVPTP